MGDRLGREVIPGCLVSERWDVTLTPIYTLIYNDSYCWFSFSSSKTVLLDIFIKKSLMFELVVVVVVWGVRVWVWRGSYVTCVEASTYFRLLSRRFRVLHTILHESTYLAIRWTMTPMVVSYGRMLTQAALY